MSDEHWPRHPVGATGCDNQSAVPPGANGPAGPVPCFDAAQLELFRGARFVPVEPIDWIEAIPNPLGVEAINATLAVEASILRAERDAAIRERDELRAMVRRCWERDASLALKLRRIAGCFGLLILVSSPVFAQQYQPLTTTLLHQSQQCETTVNAIANERDALRDFLMGLDPDHLDDTKKKIVEMQTKLRPPAPK